MTEEQMQEVLAMIQSLVPSQDDLGDFLPGPEKEDIIFDGQLAVYDESYNRTFNYELKEVKKVEIDPFGLIQIYRMDKTIYKTVNSTLEKEDEAEFYICQLGNAVVSVHLSEREKYFSYQGLEYMEGKFKLFDEDEIYNIVNLGKRFNYGCYRNLLRKYGFDLESFLEQTGIFKEGEYLRK